MSNKIRRLCNDKYAALIILFVVILSIAIDIKRLIRQLKQNINLDILVYAAYITLHINRWDRQYAESRPETRSFAPTRNTQSRTRACKVAIVSIRRLLRSQRSPSDEVRNAALRPYRWRLQSRGCRPVRRVAPDLVSGRGSICSGRACRSAAKAKGSQRGAQTHSRGHDICRAATAKRRIDSRPSPCKRNQIHTWAISTSTQYRASHRAQKKTVAEPLPAYLPPAAVSLYETIRTDLLTGRANPEGRAALRFHGMLQGLAVLLNALPAVASPSSPPPVNQSLRRDSEFVRLLANLVLHTHSELTHVC